jgi:hypothetical protein
MRNSLVDLLNLYEVNAGDFAFAYRHGYRMVRWRYADVLASARRFARELDLRGIGKGDRVRMRDSTEGPNRTCKPWCTHLSSIRS